MRTTALGLAYLHAIAPTKTTSADHAHWPALDTAATLSGVDIDVPAPASFAMTLVAHRHRIDAARTRANLASFQPRLAYISDMD